MTVETKVNTICLCIMKVVTVAFGPDNVEPTGRTGTEPLTNGNVQFGLWIESTTKIVMGHQRFDGEKDVADLLERIIIDWPRIPVRYDIAQTTIFSAS